MAKLLSVCYTAFLEKTMLIGYAMSFLVAFIALVSMDFLLMLVSSSLIYLIWWFFFGRKDDLFDFPGQTVTSQYVFGRRGNEDKIPPVFPNGWYPLKESKDVPVGKAVYVQALGEHFVIFRGEKGIATVADAWCPHLGANLGTGSTVIGDCIRCPFHHWTFDGQSGECTSVPYADKAPSAAKLRLWKSVEVSECIFVWYHADNEDPTWFPKPIKEIEDKQVVVKTKIIFSGKGHIQDIFENLSDFAHFLYVHRPGILSGHTGSFYESFWNSIMWINYDDITWQPSKEESTKHEAYVTLKNHMTIFGVFHTDPIIFNVKQSGPGIVYASMDVPRLGKLVLEELYLPVEPLKTTALVRLYGSPGIKTSLFMPVLRKMTDVMGMRDMEIWKNKCFIEKPVLAKGEKINQFRRWFSQFYSEKSPRLTKWTNLVDW